MQKIIYFIAVTIIISMECNNLRGANKPFQKNKEYLFSPTSQKGSLDITIPRSVLRNQNITLNVALLKLDSIIPTLIFGKEYSFLLKEKMINGNKTTWSGIIDGDNQSSLIISKINDIFISNFQIKGVMNQVRYIGNGTYQLRELDQSKFPNEAEPIKPNTQKKTNDDKPCNSDSEKFIDVLVFYTTAAKNASGGQSLIEAEIQLAIDETNLSYTNSGINQLVRLVGMEETSYNSLGADFTNDLNWMEGNNKVIKKRNCLGADLVALIVENGDYCGRAIDILTTLTTNNSESAFCVVRRDCSTGYYSFGHELGHLMGARHNCETDNTLSPYNYSHGYSYCNGNIKWRTIMSYDLCSSPRIPYWSNPNINYGGIPMGSTSGNCKSNNALTLNNTAPIVANFRCSNPNCCDEPEGNGINATLRTYKFTSNEILVVINRENNGYLLKFENNGGTGHNMFALNYSGDVFSSISGYSYLKGQQKFSSRILDLLFESGQLVLAFNNGKILKVNGTGGMGQNMFAVTETSNGFETVQGYNYRVGDAKFDRNVTQMIYADGKLIFAFNNKKILKVNGVGGTGHNMFAVTETSNGFETVQGYNYKVGDAKFDGNVTQMIYADGKLLLAFNNKKILKVNGVGGTGHNMFGVTETSNGFETLQGYNYRVGDAKFDGNVVQMIYADGKLILAFNNKKILKVNGVGGTGHNMFGVTETSNGFETLQGYNYRVGDAKFDGNVIQMIYAANQQIIAFNNGKILKVNGVGGSGHNMYAINETANGFESLQGYNIRIGDAKFKGNISDLDYITSSNILVVSFDNGKQIKINHLGGSGHNMFAVEPCGDNFNNSTGFNHYNGDQNYTMMH